MANIFWTKHHRQSGKDIAKHEQSPTLSHNFINFGPQTAKMGPEINPLSVNSAFCFVARRRTQRSANGAQPNFAKRDWCQPNKVVPHSECKCNHRNWVADVPGRSTFTFGWTAEAAQGRGRVCSSQCASPGDQKTFYVSNLRVGRL